MEININQLSHKLISFKVTHILLNKLVIDNYIGVLSTVHASNLNAKSKEVSFFYIILTLFIWNQRLCLTSQIKAVEISSWIF